MSPGQVGDETDDDEIIPPQPWDIECRPCEIFHDEICHLEVPNSTTIIVCTAVFNLRLFYL